MSVLHLCKLVIETTSPMAINTGARETAFDTQLVRDANGLPMIPATSIAGVWRHLVSEQFGESEAIAWFGSTSAEEGKSSPIIMSNGVIHNQNNDAVKGLNQPTLVEEDPILRLLKNKVPLHRERVAINDRGVAKNTGKFDQVLLPKGCRFSVDLRFDSARLTAKTADDWQKLLEFWHSHQFSLGASTRNGLGQFKVIAMQQSSIDLCKGPACGDEIRSFRDQATPNSAPIKPSFDEDKTIIAKLSLKAQDNWRCGSGAHILSKAKDADRSPDILTYSERCIEWIDDKAKLSELAKPVLCGSSIKGILAHRIAFHLRREQGEWAEDWGEKNHSDWQKKPAELGQLFGYADEKDHDLSVAGCILVEDSDIQYEHTVVRHHNSIDRFTGGVRQGALYSEELLYQPRFTITIRLIKKRELSFALINAIKATIEDLELGLLPMGAGSGRGTSLVLPDTNGEWMVNLSILEAKTETAVEETA